MTKTTGDRTLIIARSYHHKSTEKIAEVMAKELEAEIRTPEDVDPADIPTYGLVGLGSGIYAETHHEALLNLARRLPPVSETDAFLFSTAGIMSKTKMVRDHAALREILESKGYGIVGEFSCRGFNTNSFLKYFGGMNKGRPNAKDLERARQFARELKKHA